MEEYDYKIHKWTLLPLNCNIPVPKLQDLKILNAIATVSDAIETGYLKLGRASLLTYQEVSKILSEVSEILRSGAKWFEDNTDVTETVTRLVSDRPKNFESDFDIYDDYFDIIRYRKDDIALFYYQTLIICYKQVNDLHDSPVALSEICRGVSGINLVFNILKRNAANENFFQNSIVLSDLKLTSTHSEDHFQTALNRWKIGHAFFALMLAISSDELQRFMQNSSPHHISNAAQLFQSSTSAMWFASAFSSHMYMSYIRPSMISTNAPGGFSGTQNRDFEHWRSNKDIFLGNIRSRQLSVSQITAIQLFAEIYLLDMQSHILLASAMVSNRTSLLQDDAREKYGAKLNKSAVQILGDLYDLRKNEFSFII